MQEFKIGNNEAGQRFDKFLHKYLKEAENGFLYKMLRKKNITLNGKKADGKEILKQGDAVRFFFSQETFDKFRGKSSVDNIHKKVTENTSVKKYFDAYRSLTGIEVVYEDQHIMLLNKPAGILTQKSAPSDLSLNEWLIGRLLDKGQLPIEQLDTFKPSVCNRLDRNTSGLVICAKTLTGSQNMNRLIKERRIRKFYRTFVKGRIEKEMNIRGYLKKEESSNKVTLKTTVTEEESKVYRSIETALKPLAVLDDYSYAEVELITGRTHQIRAHLAKIGHPLLGDEKYGDRNFNRSFQKLSLPGWQLLHSYRLEFPPMEGDLSQLSGKSFTASEPEIFQTLKSQSKNQEDQT